MDRTAIGGAQATKDELLTPGEVARLFGVDPKTVTRWAAAGKLSPLRTLGGHRRYRSGEVYDLLDRNGAAAQAGVDGHGDGAE